MAAARRPAPIVLLSDVVDTSQQLTGDPGQGWTKVECASKKAYGCGDHGQELVDGLTLYVRHGDAPVLTSSPAIRVADAALRRFDSELELSCRRWMDTLVVRHRMTTLGRVQMAEEQGLTVIFLVFRRDLA
ncbi:uncharacterized protein [Setaria viridis]|uniref:uncharacterized protein n=1 Tax=Setaria viridis TaxID=4556 RepID=UPI003B3ABE4C